MSLCGLGAGHCCLDFEHVGLVCVLVFDLGLIAVHRQAGVVIAVSTLNILLWPLRVLVFDLGLIAIHRQVGVVIAVSTLNIYCCGRRSRRSFVLRLGAFRPEEDGTRGRLPARLRPKHSGPSLAHRGSQKVESRPELCA